MRIAVDCRMLGKSGIGVYLENILQELVRIGGSCTFLLIGSEKEIAPVAGNSSSYDILPCPIPIFSKDEFLRFPVREVNRCDAYYTPNINIPRGISVQVYSTIHDVAFLDVKIASYFGRAIRKYMFKRAIRLSTKIFTVSKFSKERILHHFQADKEIIVTYNGINGQLKDHTASAQSPYPFEYILYVGNIKKHKGLSTLLKGFAEAKKNGMSKKLIIVGSAENFRTKDSEIIKFLQAQHDDIIFTGRVPDKTLYDIIAHTQCLIQPSLYEGFGIPPLEALYLGRPVILSDIPVFREIYGDLPVQLFETGNSQMLAEKMLDIKIIVEPISQLRDKINDSYSYYSSAKIVFGAITGREIVEAIKL
jgi:glycosyltransferase involved in cell wall biosynthesis